MKKNTVTTNHLHSHGWAYRCTLVGSRSVLRALCDRDELGSRLDSPAYMCGSEDLRGLWRANILPVAIYMLQHMAACMVL